MALAATTGPLSEEQSAALAEFARSCKTAARSVSLYPSTHPAIRHAMTRVSAATARLAADGHVELTVHPDTLVVDGRGSPRPDAAVGELASLLHERLIGALRVERDADADDWLALLLLLGRTPEDLLAAGGIGQAWAASGRAHFDIREIDYAEVLREKAGGDTAEWDRIVAYCLQGESAALDDRALASLVSAVSDPVRFGELLDRLQHAPAAGGATMGARAAALLRLLRAAVDAACTQGPDAGDRVLQTIADSSARLTPDMLLAILAQRQSPNADDARIASGIIDRMSDGTIASFVAASVTAERHATERLAHAFEALIPEAERKARLLEVAHGEAQQTELGREAGFDELWQGAANMLMSYSDKSYVSAEYGDELSAARTQAIEVERVSDDPPERVRQWLSTVSAAAVRQLDLDLLRDLLRIEPDAALWQPVAAIVSAEIERRTLLGEVADAQALAESLVCEVAPDGRVQLQPAAAGILERLSSGPLVRHIVLHLRKAEDADAGGLSRLCHTIGPGVVRPLAEALAVEENSRAIRRLRELLLGFGAAGRQSVERLKSSSNPAVRRTAIDLLRVFGGHEALPELASMLGDADPQVQRESIRAIVQIGTEGAHAVLERALVAGSASRDAILQQLIGLRDDKATPLLCYVLNHTPPRGKFARAHAEIIEALGGLGTHPESTRTLRQVLYRGSWWAPFKTAVLRRAAATALMRIGSPDTTTVLEEASRHGSRGVRNAARAQADAGARRGRERP